LRKNFGMFLDEFTQAFFVLLGKYQFIHRYEVP
jgi:hypothetical protein